MMEEEASLTAVAKAIQISYDPYADRSLKHQAFEYVNQFRLDPRNWQPCLSIFAKIPRHPEIVRHFCLEIVSNAVQAGLVDTQGLAAVKEQLMSYLQASLRSNVDTEADGTLIQNKIAQTITYLFTAFYANGWESFFDNILALASSGGDNQMDNMQGIIFYLRVVNSIHDEIGDQLLSRSREEQDRANTLKDLIRMRDVEKVASSWQEILSKWADSISVCELCLRAIGKWVSWIDIGLVVNQAMLNLLFQQLERAQKTDLGAGEEHTRDAAIDVFTEITGKKMQPADKIDMISFLNLESVISQLISCPPLNEHRGGPRYDTDLAETVAKLVNTAMLDIVKVLETGTGEGDYWQHAERMLQSFLPLVLRFFADEYDEVCSTVIPSINDTLSFLRKSVKDEPTSPQRLVMLLPILKAIFAKMRYDETSSWGDDDDGTDEAEFQELRKRLHVLQNTIAQCDEQLFVDAVRSLVDSTFEKLKTTQLDWRDLDLALYEIFMFGDVAVKSGGLYAKNKPNSPTAENLVQMMVRMVDCDIQSFNHPATQLQYMEICVRYSTFFDHHTHLIPRTLQHFLQFVHHPQMKVKTRAWYLFHRLVRSLRSHVGNTAEQVVESLSDLLPISAEIPDSARDDASSESHDSSAYAIFQSQLFLFEAIGCICGGPAVPVDKQVFFGQSVMNPIFSDIESNLARAKAADERATWQIHHDLMALGTLARGFSDWIPGASTQSTPLPVEVRVAFASVSEATLVSLESLRTSSNIREASRFTFSRLIGVMGSEILPQLPRWIEGLLGESSTKDEMALFLRLLDQIIFGFKTEIYPVLDSLLTPFLQRVFAGLSESAAGTDDEIQLAELKREYLNFLLVLMNNNLGSVVISSTNQSIFESVIGTIEYFTKDAEDCPTAKMAFAVLSKMSMTWGGPDIVSLGDESDRTSQSEPQPMLPGFDRYMISRFSPLCWAFLKTSSFSAKDAQARQVLGEAATLQKTIYLKTGQEYLSWLRENELRNMGMNDEMISEYLENLVRQDQKGFKIFFQNVVLRATGGK
ncbi:MAG: hypothetical protein Q9227_005147 [Pyrenula ochraceoflavens]